jgi:hypothetical protein
MSEEVVVVVVVFFPDWLLADVDSMGIMSSSPPEDGGFWNEAIFYSSAAVDLSSRMIG